MGRIFLLLLALTLMGCEKGYDGQQEAISADLLAAYQEVANITDDLSLQLELARETDAYWRAVHRRDSLLSRGPSIRTHHDSLARVDSTTYAYLKILKISNLYHYHDTTSAVFAYLDALPWFGVLPLFSRADHFRRFAETLGDAVDLTHSPNMARLSFQAFERAKRLALDHGDPFYIHLADSSYKAVAHQVLTMPDSVRSAFGPAPERPARIPWVLATLAAAFIAATVAGGWRVGPKA